MEKMDLKACVRSVRDFPKEGVVFRDVTTLFQNPDAFEQLMQEMVASLQGLDVDLVLGPEARGFTVASVLAYALHAGFVPVRKPGKLPAETVSYSYDLEYGSDTLEIHRDAIRPGMRVAVADDLLATGGTALAAWPSSSAARSLPCASPLSWRAWAAAKSSGTTTWTP